MTRPRSWERELSDAIARKTPCGMLGGKVFGLVFVPASYLTIAFVVFTAMFARPLIGDDATDLISGFDRTRIASLMPPTDPTRPTDPTDPTKTGELAKLIFRLANTDEAALRSRVGQQASIGHAVMIEGTIQSAESLKVPDGLVEFLDLSTLSIVRVRVGDQTMLAIAPPISASARAGDRVSGIGVALDDEGRSVAIGRLRWMPAVAPSAGWQLLADAGVDLGLLADVTRLNRKPLLAADGDAFYAMLASTPRVAGDANLPAPPTFGPVKLLTDARAQVGQWMRLNVETAQVTRITVTQPDRREQLGQDHYFQIDAFADLGDVVIRVETGGEPGDESAGESAVFENRYPVSIVTLSIPTVLAGDSGDRVIVAEVSRQVTVDGFFYRLWSYKSQYMKRFGDAEQFGPLVIAARIVDAAPGSRDPVGVSAIGWIAAAAVLTGLIVTIVWHRRTTSGDRAIRKKQKQREGKSVTLPRADDLA